MLSGSRSYWVITYRNLKNICQFAVSKKNTTKVGSFLRKVTHKITRQPAKLFTFQFLVFSYSQKHAKVRQEGIKIDNWKIRLLLIQLTQYFQRKTSREQTKSAHRRSWLTKTSLLKYAERRYNGTFLKFTVPEKVPRETHKTQRRKGFPKSEGRTPNKQFCLSKSAPFQILSPHIKQWYHVCSQVVKQWST